MRRVEVLLALVGALHGDAVVAAAGEHASPDELRSERRVSVHGGGSRTPRPGGASPARFRPLEPVQSVLGGTCDAIQVAGGDRGAFALASDGHVWAWGRNRYLTLGSADTAFDTSFPVIHPWLTGVSAISTHPESRFVAALLGDGTVVAWGDTTCGLGDGLTLDSASPVPVSGLVGITAIAVGKDHALARRDDGAVFAWGCNSQGQVGNGSTTNAPIPVQVLPPGNVVAIAAGSTHSLALAADGTARAWGRNNRGQLGDGTVVNQTAPVAVMGLVDATALAAGREFSMALRAGGSVLSWGRNDEGQLGQGTLVDAPVPGPVSGLAGVSRLAAGIKSGFAVRSNGTVAAWGGNFFLELAAVQIEFASLPRDVPGLTGVAAMGAGWEVALALRDDGSVATWGLGTELGNGHHTEINVPVPMLTGNFARVDAGDYHALAVDMSGEVFGWGWNWAAMATTGARHAGISHPTAISGFTGARDVAAGFEHSLLIDAAGAVWGWGSNFFGGVGDGTLTDRFDPVPSSGLGNAVDVVACWESSYALLADGTVRAWGANDYGQLGNGTYIESAVPVTVSLDQVAELDCYELHVVARRTDGTVWAWGAGEDGQLGDGNFEDSPDPIQVPGLANAIAVAATGHASLAVTSDGQVWAWGDNLDGVLGDPARGGASGVPGVVPNLSGVVKLAGGHATVHALLSDQTVMSWAGNFWGQLGSGSTQRMVFVPEPVLGLTQAAAITAGEEHFIARRSDGSVIAAGYNLEGQLGDGDVAATHLPVAVSFDAPPPEQGNVLLAVRSGTDVVLEFMGAPASAWRIDRDLTPQTIGTTPHSPDLFAPTFLDLGAVSLPDDLYYYLRGLSACTSQPGP